ncbi:ribonuclease HII [Dethiosulfatarculus sandiegensis]|uniref:ribonuclease HII n=1 Tax=Dethiosulfatarculus sandiegensis TaxID=1429043 RepID=UPI000AF71244|nr:ribonuclease HII [Dethiosulfatarculus sandiegensis]
MPRKLTPMASKFELEARLRRQGYALLAGLDEVGRGPLAGPVVAACVILPEGWEDPGVADSKKLSAKKREELAAIIGDTAVASGIGQCDPDEIDRLNIHQASLTAMARALLDTSFKPDHLLVDGRFTIESRLPQIAVIKGDGLCQCIGAASILAKVHRDALMLKWHEKYPQYNFAANKGYPTKEHRRMLTQIGPSPIHRKSYAPVAQMSFLGL